MKNLRKLLSLLLCVCMLMSVAALAEDTVAPEASAVTEIAPETVLLTVNGQEITWADVEADYNAMLSEYSYYYDMTQQSNIDMVRAMAMETSLLRTLLFQKAEELGLSPLSAEEAAAQEATADADWEAAIADYLAYMRPDITADSSEEDKAAARAEAEAYYNQMGYSPEILRESYKQNAVLIKVQDSMIQDAVVTDAEVEAYYNEAVAADQAMFEGSPEAYVEYEAQQQMMYMYGMSSEVVTPWYKPAGFRNVQHILLSVDENLMAQYTDLQARYEEQQSGEPAEETEGETEVVTIEMVNEAKAAVLASCADTTDEIYQKIADGADFEALIAEYSTDPGANSLYEVCAASTLQYVPEFVEGAMSIEAVGGISAPYLSNYGIHIIKYVSDVPGGAIAFTDELRTQIYEDLLYEKQNALYVGAIETWMSEATITYTGVVPSMEELEAANAADAAAESAE